MAPTQSSLSGNSSLIRGNHPRSISSGGATTHGGEGFMISSSKPAKNKLKLKVALPFTTDDKVHLCPIMEMILKTTLMFDPMSCFKFNNPLCSPINKVKDITKIPEATIEKYVMDLQTVITKKQFVFFLTLETTTLFSHLKFNKKLFNWLTNNDYWLTFHSMNMNHSIPIGFFIGVHPTLSSCNALSELLSQYFEMEDIKFALISMGSFYITSNRKKANTKVVELHVNASNAEHSHDLLSCLWLDPTFSQELDKCSIGVPIEFIPSIQHGIIDVPTYHECLSCHREFAENTIAVSVVSIGGLDIVIKCMGMNVSLAKMIKQLQNNGKPLFSGIELTKFTNAEGRYLLDSERYHRQS
jgi:hypothetical protein